MRLPDMSTSTCTTQNAGLVLAAVVATVLVACVGDPQASDRPVAHAAVGAELDLRIDGNEADLVPITWLGVSPSGQIALIQGQDRNVRFFNASGTSLGILGRDGEGPGEFRRPLRGGWIGDTLWVSDTQLNRITLIGPTLEPLVTIAHPSIVPVPSTDGTPDAVFGSNLPYGVLARDTLLVVPMSIVDGPRPDANTGSPILRTTSAGEFLNEVARMPLDENPVASVNTERGVVSYRVPFQARSAWSVSGDGRLVAILTHDMNSPDGSRFRVRVRDLNGDQRMDQSFPFEPVRIPSARLDSAIAATAARQPAIRPQLERALREAAPANYPGAERVVIGQDDRVFVGLWPDEQGQKWLVLDLDGEPVDTVMLPPRVTLQEASATHLWAVERGDYDVESVVRYRLTAGGR